MMNFCIPCSTIKCIILQPLLLLVKMTASNSGLNIALVLVLLCLGIVFLSGQSSLVEQRIKAEVQAEKIQQLIKQLDLLQLYSLSNIINQQ